MSESLSKEEVRELWQRGYEDPGFFCQFFLPHWFRQELSWFHYGLLAILTKKVSWLEYLPSGTLDKILRHFVWKEDPEDDESTEHPIFFYDDQHRLCLFLRKYTLVMVPRGFGKTTIVNAAIIYAICYEECRFPTYVSESGSHAQAQLKNVKDELGANHRIQLVFGDMRPAQRQGYKWTEDWIECTNGVNVVARGRGAQIRGLLLSGRRPDRFIVDDVEDEESVRTADQREKTREWAYKGLIPALDETEEATLVALGTLLDGESQLMTWRRDPEFNTVVLEAVDRDGEATWPERMPLEALERKKQSFALAGMLHAYYMEYHNVLRVSALAKFRREFIIYQQPEREMQKAIAIDPAISERKEADFFALGVDGMDERGYHTVLDVVMERGVSPRDQVDLLFKYSLLYWPVMFHGIESVAFQRALVHLVHEEMFSRNHYFEVTPILHGQVGKVERVEGVLQPRYAAGYMRHARRFPLYESQLLDWPRGRKDGPDVIAMAITLLDPFAYQAIHRSLTEDAKLPEVPEEVIEGEWRRAV